MPVLPISAFNKIEGIHPLILVGTYNYLSAVNNCQ